MIAVNLGSGLGMQIGQLGVQVKREQFQKKAPRNIEGKKKQRPEIAGQAASAPGCWSNEPVFG